MKTKLLSVLTVFAMTITAAFGAWQPGLKRGEMTGTSPMNRVDFPAVTNSTLTIDKAMVNGWPAYTTYVYWGQIYLDGSAYRFGEAIDDDALLIIGGVTVLDNTAANTATFGTVELEAGWYDFELRMNNRASGGGAMAKSGFSVTKGFGFAKGTKAEMDALKSGSTMVIPADDGFGVSFPI